MVTNKIKRPPPSVAICKSASRLKLLRSPADILCLFTLVFLAVGTPVMAQKADGNYSAKLQTLTNDLGMSFVKIPTGSFMMWTFGTLKSTHRVTIPKAFHLQTTEVTQGQWKAVMRTSPWLGKVRNEGDDYPAQYLSWDDAQEFIQKLNARGDGTYRLPTEEEWEYACRAGTTTEYSFGDDVGRLGDFAWFDKKDDTGEDYAHRVGLKRPNPWGLYDMHGNVREWCQDRSGKKSTSAKTDPAGSLSDWSRPVRGGSWAEYASGCRSGQVRYFDGSDRCPSCGFRVMWVPAPKMR